MIKLKTRCTHHFIEIDVDSINTTIFKSRKEIDDQIINLLEAVDNLLDYTDKTINDFDIIT